MAFKELSEKDLELMTDSQRKAYEEELLVYRERVNFVEQLERMENVQIEPYQPTLNPIPPVRKAPEKHFVRSEYPVQKLRPLEKPISKVKAIMIAPIAAPLLPMQFIPLDVHVDSVKKIKEPSPILPAGTAVQIPNRDVKAVGPVKAEIRPTIKVQIPDVKQIQAETVKVQVEAAQKPVLKKPRKITFEKPPVTFCSVSVPSARACIPNVVVPAPTKPDLPQAAVPFATIREPRIAVPQMTALPRTSAVRRTDISYTWPDAPAVAVNDETIPAIPKAKVSAYTAPVIRMPEGTVRVQPARTPERTFRMDVKPAPQMIKPEPIGIPEKNFEKPGYNVKPLPEAEPVSIPDPHSNESIHALLKRVRKQ